MYPLLFTGVTSKLSICLLQSLSFLLQIPKNSLFLQGTWMGMVLPSPLCQPNGQALIFARFPIIAAQLMITEK